MIYVFALLLLSIVVLLCIIKDILVEQSSIIIAEQEAAYKQMSTLITKLNAIDYGYAKEQQAKDKVMLQMAALGYPHANFKRRKGG